MLQIKTVKKNKELSERWGIESEIRRIILRRRTLKNGININGRDNRR